MSRRKILIENCNDNKRIVRKVNLNEWGKCVLIHQMIIFFMLGKIKKYGMINNLIKCKLLNVEEENYYYCYLWLCFSIRNELREWKKTNRNDVD